MIIEISPEDFAERAKHLIGDPHFKNLESVIFDVDREDVLGRTNSITFNWKKINE